MSYSSVFPHTQQSLFWLYIILYIIHYIDFVCSLVAQICKFSFCLNTFKGETDWMVGGDCLLLLLSSALEGLMLSQFKSGRLQRSRRVIVSPPRRRSERVKGLRLAVRIAIHPKAFPSPSPSLPISVSCLISAPLGITSEDFLPSSFASFMPPLLLFVSSSLL